MKPMNFNNRWLLVTGASSGLGQAMARQLADHMFEATPFPVAAYDALVAGLSVMAIDRAARTGEVVDCGDWWRELDALYPTTEVAVD